MMGKLAVVIVFLLVFIAACTPRQPELKARPLNLSEPVVKDVCSDVKCGLNEVCVGGDCVCASGFVGCDGRCIPESGCCTSGDCGKDSYCVNNVCVEREFCNYNEEWDSERGKCVCADGTRFCKEQGKCVPVNNCCAYNDCADDQRCAPTLYAASICLTHDGKKCKTISEGRDVSFVFPGNEVQVRVERVIEGGVFDLRVNNQSFSRLGVNDTVQVDGFGLLVEKFLGFGGYCREESGVD